MRISALKVRVLCSAPKPIYKSLPPRGRGSARS
nr:MAG TPA: hypothetical protein [Caudoviricetes sp.]DAX43301.1 MAG TPA: hypothetical protein [Caudoviricetes sp.]